MKVPSQTEAGEAPYECMKHQIRMSAGEARCRDPELYCKFRPACLIHFLEKEKARAQRRAAS